MTLETAQLIGIHGLLNSGKDTVANIIQEIYPSVHRRYAFAKPLKEACKVLFGFSDEQLEDRVLKEAVDPFWGFSPRRAMQLIGTEYGRNMLRDDVWIRRAEQELLQNERMGFRTIITDVRFENEAAWIRGRSDAVLVYIESPDIVKDSRYSHASEAGISRDPRDLVIVNNKARGLHELQRNIIRLL